MEVAAQQNRSLFSALYRYNFNIHYMQIGPFYDDKCTKGYHVDSNMANTEEIRHLRKFRQSLHFEWYAGCGAMDFPLFHSRKNFKCTDEVLTLAPTAIQQPTTTL